MASANESINWRDAAYHYAAIQSHSDVQRVLVNSASAVMASGEFDVAETYAKHLGPDLAQPVFDVYYSRIALDRGDLVSAAAKAESAYRALAHTPGSLSQLAMANLASILYALGDLETAHTLATTLRDTADDPDLRAIAGATALALETSIAAPIADYVRLLEHLEEDHRRSGKSHYLAVTLLNLSLMHQVAGDAPMCLARATEAAGLLQSHPAAGELTAARLARAWALFHLGRSDDARLEVSEAIHDATGLARSEALIEALGLANWYGSQDETTRLLALAKEASPPAAAMRDVLILAEAELEARRGRASEARAILEEHGGPRLSTEAGHEARRQVVAGRTSVGLADSRAVEDIDAALDFARRQGSTFHAGCLRVLRAAVAPGPEFEARLSLLAETAPVYLSVMSEVVAGRLHELSTSTFDLATREAECRPERWRDGLRQVVRDAGPGSLRAAVLLEKIGTAEDIPPLRRTARRLRGKGLSAGLGRELARRLAPRVFVEDQGRLQVRVGSRLVPDDDVRRKVLSILCFLITRPGLSATRDEVVEAVWPEVDPSSAVNSLNQTLYFLRRVLEPEYDEELSATYVHHDSDVIWLDEALVDSRSRHCGRLIARIADSGMDEDVSTLAREYKAKFALDFSYEEWASAYRETLHAAYLETIERAVAAKLACGEPAHGIALVRRALQVDPDAEQLERLLLRAYHETGARAAVGEQYAHYAAFLRNELGIEPPDLDALIAHNFDVE